MSSKPCPCSDDIRREALSTGAVACGFAEATRVDDCAIAFYDRWIEHGYNGTMQYCEKYRDVRDDPRLLLEGARTVISCAFNYYNFDVDQPLSSKISKYAWGKDYHWVIKSRLSQLSEYIVDKYGGACRVCVDTAPIRERYWAARAGIGFIGINNQLIVPGYGSYCFIGEVLWTGEIAPDKPCEDGCGQCQRCVKACPGKALDGKGGCDATRCVSYLTIEYRGALDSNATLGGSCYGCDVCQNVCPHNSVRQCTLINEFKPDEALLSKTEDDIQGMSSSQFRRLTRESAMSRITLAQLRRNLSLKGKR